MSHGYQESITTSVNKLFDTIEILNIEMLCRGKKTLSALQNNTTFPISSLVYDLIKKNYTLIYQIIHYKTIKIKTNMV